MVKGSIPSQGTCLGYGFDSGQGAYERQPIDVPQGTAPACKLLYSQTYWGLSLISCVTLGPLLHLSEPPLPHLCVDTATDPSRKAAAGSSEVMRVKWLAAAPTSDMPH